VDRQVLEEELQAAFDADAATASVVARQARDLADAGQFAEDFDAELTASDVVGNLRDAPEDYSLVERWNWWLGSLDISHGGYARFSVRPDVDSHS
jgi:hypothetical protein